MGANIGTSVTNTIVAMGQVADKTQFRRAFAGATVHDMFNWLAVLILLPIEVATNYLHKLTGRMVDAVGVDTDVDEPQFLSVLTDPLTSLIVQVRNYYYFFSFARLKSFNRNFKSARLKMLIVKSSKLLL